MADKIQRLATDIQVQGWQSKGNDQALCGLQRLNINLRA